MDDEIRIVKVKYAITLEKEFDKNFEPLEGEHFEFKEIFQIIWKRWFGARRGLIALTNFRLIIYLHFYFVPDKLFYIPYKSIQDIAPDKYLFGFPAVKIHYADKKFVLVNRKRLILLGYGLYNSNLTLQFLELLKSKLKSIH